MGLTVNSFLKKKLQGIDNGIIEQHLSDFNIDKSKKQQVWVVDVSLFLHRILRNDNDDNQHISGFLNLIAKLRSFNIHPIFVFDGKPSKHKKKKLNSRRKNREKSWKKKEELEKIIANSNEDLSSSIESLPETLQLEIKNKIIEEEDKNNDTHENINPQIIEEITQEIVKKEQIKLAKRCVKKTESHYADLKELFNYFNLSYIHIEDEEADTICYSLCLCQDLDFEVDCILSNDMDFLAYCYDKNPDRKIKYPSLIRDFNFKNDYVKRYDCKKIQKRLKLSNQQFTDFCILMGTDYNKPLGMDFTSDAIYDLIYKYQSIENILEYFKTLEQYKKILDSLLFNPDRPESSIQKFISLTNKDVEKENIDELTNYLKDKVSNLKKIDTKFSYQQSRNIFQNSILIKQKDIHNYDKSLSNYLGNYTDNFDEKVKSGIKYIKGKCISLKYNLIDKKVRQIYQFLNNNSIKCKKCNKRKNSRKNYHNNFSNWKNKKNNNFENINTGNINTGNINTGNINTGNINTGNINNISDFIDNRNNNTSFNTSFNTNFNTISSIDSIDSIDSNNTIDSIDSNNTIDNTNTVNSNYINIIKKESNNLFKPSSTNNNYIGINNLNVRNSTISPIHQNENDILQETLFIPNQNDEFISISIDKNSNNIIESMCFV